MTKRKKNSLMNHKNHPLGRVLLFSKYANRMFLGIRAILIFPFFQKSLLCVFPSFAPWFTGFRTVFDFALRPFPPMWVLFFGFNGNFNGKMTKSNKMAKNHFYGSKMVPKVS